MSGHVRSFERLNSDFDPSAWGGRPRIVFFGDSDISHWRDEDAFPEDWGIYVGVGGACMSDVAAYAPRLIEKYAPSAIIAVAGENDIAESYAQQPRGGKKKHSGTALEFPPTPIRHFEDFFRCVVVSHGVPLVFLSCKPEPATKDLWGLYRRYDTEIQKVMDAYAVGRDTPTKCTLLDNSQMSAGKYFSHDKLHLSRAGYDVWNYDVVQALRGMGFDVPLPS